MHPNDKGSGDEQLSDELRAAGFSQARVLDAMEGNERYFKDRADGGRLYGSGRMMAAQVWGRPYCSA